MIVFHEIWPKTSSNKCFLIPKSLIKKLIIFLNSYIFSLNPYICHNVSLIILFYEYISYLFNLVKYACSIVFTISYI